MAQTDPRKIVSDGDVERIHGVADFGDGMSKRDVVNQGVWYVACGWHSGHTMKSIVVQHGLARWRRDRQKPLILTAKGRKYLFAALRKAKIDWRSDVTTQ